MGTVGAWHPRRVLRLLAILLVPIAAVTCGDRELSTPIGPSGTLLPGSTTVVGTAESGWASAMTGVLASLSIDPSVFKGGTSTRGTVTLHEPAPAGGLAIALAVDDTAASVPVGMNIADGATSGTFIIMTKTVAADLPIRVTASAGGASLTALMRLTPENAIASLTVSPAVILAGHIAEGTVTLSSTSPSGGTDVRLNSNQADAIILITLLTIPAGLTSDRFFVVTRDVSSAAEAWITATVKADTRAVQIRIVPRTHAHLFGTVRIGGVVE